MSVVSFCDIIPVMRGVDGVSISLADRALDLDMASEDGKIGREEFDRVFSDVDPQLYKVLGQLPDKTPENSRACLIKHSGEVFLVFRVNDITYYGVMTPAIMNSEMPVKSME